MAVRIHKGTRTVEQQRAAISEVVRQCWRAKQAKEAANRDA